MEHRLPRRIHSREKGDTDMSQYSGRVGFIFFTSRPEDVTLRSGQLPEGTKWILSVDFFIDFRRPGVGADGPHGMIFLAIDEQGALLDNPIWHSFCGSGAPDDLTTGYVSWIYPALLAITFLHCKNVGVAENPVPEKLAKKFRKAHGFAPTPHKTLIIEPLKAILKREGRSEEIGPAAGHAYLPWSFCRLYGRARPVREISRALLDADACEGIEGREAGAA